MTSSELIKAHHLQRKAVIYVRQSSLAQVQGHLESQKLQYALKDRASQLGWRENDIIVIDCDLGLSGSSAHNRIGFKDLVARVTLGEVGIILSYDITRLSRNCSDWYQLLDLCGFRDTLIADSDSIYDSTSADGRLILGLKGQISELELHTIRSRLNAGLLNKAKRGELALKLPAGYIRLPNGHIEKTPNLEVQNRIELVFETFKKVKSAAKTVRFFNQEELLIPRTDQYGDLVWRKPTLASVMCILKNPAYAGIYVYGKTKSVLKKDALNQKSVKKLEPSDWKVKIEDHHPGYISVEDFHHIQIQIEQNYADYDRNRTRGIPRPGQALLHGLVSCGECGHKMVVQYKGGARYICNYHRAQYQTSVCQYITADPIDKKVLSCFFEVISSAEINLYEQALELRKQEQENIFHAKRQELQRLHYEASLAEKCYKNVDPQNRLVASELERRWENALAALEAAQEHFTALTQDVERIPVLLTQKLKSAFENVGKNLQKIWNDEILPREQRKAFLRSLIDKVIIHRETRDHVRTRIIWRGGEQSSFLIPIPVGSFHELKDSKQIVNMILDLTKSGKTDKEVADILTKKGYHSPMSSTFLKSTVQIIRLRNKVLLSAGQSHPRRIKGYLTVPQLAQALNTTPHWIYDRIHKGDIVIEKSKENKLYLFPDQSTTLDQFELYKTGKLKKLDF